MVVMPGTTVSLGHQQPLNALMPDTLGSYRINTLIGRGGIGSVYRATAQTGASVPVGTEVAIKVLTRAEVPPSDRLRFAREASYLQALRHPGIVRILDLDMEAERPYLVMEHLNGKPFDRLIKETTEPLEPSYAAELLAQAAEALHVAHLAGILHRDLKPGNLFLTKEGIVKLLDFGLAQNTDTDSQMTATGAVLGTPAYMSPEQAGGLRDELSRRSDVYALGAVGYEMVAGRPPYVASNSMAILRQILEGPPSAPCRHNPALPLQLDTVISHAMERFPEDRYRTAEALAADLRRFHRGIRVRAHRVGPMTLLRRGLWRHRKAAVIVATLSLFLLAGIVVGVKQLRRIVEEREQASEVAVTEIWETTWEQPGPLAYEQAIPFPLDKEMSMLDLEPTPGNLRLSGLLDLPNEANFQILFNDPDIGRGYVASFTVAEESLHVSLARGQSGPLATVAEASVPMLAVYPIRVQRQADQIKIWVDDELTISWRDLVPIEGDLNGGLYLALSDQAAAENFRLEVTTSPYVSALEQADVLRQNKAYRAAQLRYEKFLRFHGDRPEQQAEVLAAEFRIGLCLHGIASEIHGQNQNKPADTASAWQEALEHFLYLAQRAQTTELGSRYLGPSLFYAWDCSLHLGDFLQADSYFDRLREEFDLATVFATMPPEVRRNLPKQYRQAALEAGYQQDSDGAERLFITAEAIATLAGDHLIRAICLRDRAGLALALGNGPAALALINTVIEDTAIPHAERGWARVDRAHTLDYLDQTDLARAAYADAVGFARSQKLNEVIAWARLWETDFAWRSQPNLDPPIGTWREIGKRTRNDIQRIARSLERRAWLKLRDKNATFYYFQAAISTLRQDEKKMWQNLEDAARQQRWWRFPALFARKRLQIRDERLAAEKLRKELEALQAAEQNEADEAIPTQVVDPLPAE
jgi:hypothetical protein